MNPNYIPLKPGMKFSMGVSSKLALKKHQKGVRLNGRPVNGDFDVAEGDVLELTPDYESHWVLTTGWYPSFGRVTLKALRGFTVSRATNFWSSPSADFEFVSGAASVHHSNLLVNT